MMNTTTSLNGDSDSNGAGESTTNGAGSGYRRDGLVSHNKPVGSDSQFTMGDGQIPGFAYWLRSKELEMYRRLSRAGANASQGIDAARQTGFDIFTGVWGIFERSYLGQVAGLQPELARLRFDSAAIEHELSQTPRSKPVEPAPARMPVGLCRWGWFALWALILLVCIGEGQNVAQRIFLLTQNWFTSWVGGGVLVMAMAVALHAAVHGLCGWPKTISRYLIPILGLISFAFWAYLFAQNYADGSGQRQDANGLPMLPDDRLLLCAQIVAGCLAVMGMMDGARALQLHPVEMQLNPSWETLNGRWQTINIALGETEHQLGVVEGRLSEYRSCRESFIAVGLAEYQNALELTRIYQQRVQQLNHFSDN